MLRASRHFPQPGVGAAAARAAGGYPRGELEGPPIAVERYLSEIAAAARAVPAVAVTVGLELEHWPDDPRVREVQDAFVAVRLRSTLDQTEPQRRGNWSSVLASPAEMEERFADHPDAVAETERIAERCEFDLTRDLGYRYPGSEDLSANRKLAELCRARLDKRYL